MRMMIRFRMHVVSTDAALPKMVQVKSSKRGRISVLCGFGKHYDVPLLMGWTWQVNISDSHPDGPAMPGRSTPIDYSDDYHCIDD